MDDQIVNLMMKFLSGNVETGEEIVIGNTKISVSDDTLNIDNSAYIK